jgi:hypothetical protein
VNDACRAQRGTKTARDQYQMLTLISVEVGV